MRESIRLVIWAESEALIDMLEAEVIIQARNLEGEYLEEF